MTMGNIISDTISRMEKVRTRILEWNERLRILGEDAGVRGDGACLQCILFSCVMVLELASTLFLCDGEFLKAILGTIFGFAALALFVRAYFLIARERPSPTPDTFRRSAWMVGIGSVLALAGLLVQMLTTSVCLGVSGALPFVFILLFKEDFGPAFRSSETPKQPRCT